MRTFLFILLCCTAQAQVLLPAKENGQWGYISDKGLVMLPFRYSYAESFGDKNFATVMMGKRAGLINKSGREIVSPQYDDVSFLSGSLIMLRSGNMLGLCDTSGRVLLPCTCEAISSTGPGYFSVKQGGRQRLYSLWRRSLVGDPCDSICTGGPLFRIIDSGHQGVIDSMGKEVLPPLYDEASIANPDLIFFRQGIRWGAAGHGEMLIPPRFTSYIVLSPTLVQLRKDSLFALFSLPARRIITREIYSSFLLLDGGYIIASQYLKEELMDSIGNTILPLESRNISQAGPGLFRVSGSKGMYGLVNSRGKEILPAEYDAIEDFTGGFARIQKGKLYGLVAENGELVHAATETNIEVFRGIAKIRQDGKLKMYTYAEGKVQEDAYENIRTIRVGNREVFKDPRNLRPRSSNTGWYYSETAKKWGLKDLNSGRVLIEPAYDDIRIISSIGLTMVEVSCASFHLEIGNIEIKGHGLVGIVDHVAGKVITPPDLVLIRVADFQKADMAFCVNRRGDPAILFRTGFVRKLFGGGYLGDIGSSSTAPFNIGGTLEAAAERDTQEAVCPMRRFVSEMRGSASTSLYANADRKGPLYVFCKGGRWGYLNNAKTVMEPAFEFARTSYNDTYIVKQQGRYGVINARGEPVILALYDNIEYLPASFHTLFRLQQNGGKYTFASSQGRIVCDLTFDETGNFSEQMARVRQGNHWTYISDNGERAVRDSFEKANDFSEGMTGVRKGHRWGFIGSSGEFIIDPSYSKVGKFSEGLAWFSKNGKSGYINTTGDTVIPPIYDRAYEFGNDVARVKKGRKTGLIDRRGKWITSPSYDRIGEFDKDGLAIVCKNGRYGIIDRSGNRVVRCRFSSISSFSEGLALVKEDGACGFIDEKGKIAISMNYSGAGDFSEGLARVRIAGKWGYIGTSGEVVIEPAFESCMDFREGLAAVKQRGTWYYIDQQGDPVISDPRGAQDYVKLDFFRGQLAAVQDHGGFSYISNDGSTRIKGKYDYAFGFEDSVARVNINGGWGLINRNGIPLVAARYSRIDPFKEGFAKVYMKNLSGIANLQGKIILSPGYESVEMIYPGIYRVERAGRVGYYHSSKGWIRPLSR